MSKLEIKHGDNYDSVSIDSYRAIKEEKFRYILDSVRMKIKEETMNDIEYGIWHPEFKNKLIQTSDRLYEYAIEEVINGKYIGINFNESDWIPKRLIKVISDIHVGYIASVDGFYAVVANRYDDSDFIALKDENKLRMLEDFQKYE